MKEQLKMWGRRKWREQCMQVKHKEQQQRYVHVRALLFDRKKVSIGNLSSWSHTCHSLSSSAQSSLWKAFIRWLSRQDKASLVDRWGKLEESMAATHHIYSKAKPARVRGTRRYWYRDGHDLLSTWKPSHSWKGHMSENLKVRRIQKEL